MGFGVIPEAEGPFPASIEAARRPLVRHLGGRNSAKMPPPPLSARKGGIERPGVLTSSSIDNAPGSSSVVLDGDFDDAEEGRGHGAAVALGGALTGPDRKTRPGASPLSLGGRDPGPFHEIGL